MTALDELVRYDGRRVVVTGCASGIGVRVVDQLAALGARVTGLDVREPERNSAAAEFVAVDLADPKSVAAAADAIDGDVDALFNVAGVSSGIGDPVLVMRINFLGMRQLTEALIERMPDGSAIANVSSLAASGYRDNARTTAGLLDTSSVDEGLRWCAEHPEALADGGYRQSKEAIILYGMRKAVELGPRGIRVNCSAPGVTETPILDQLRSRYGQQYLDSFTAPLGRVSTPEEQAALLVFLGSRAAGYITGQVVWADGGISAERFLAESTETDVTQRS